MLVLLVRMKITLTEVLGLCMELREIPPNLMIKVSVLHLCGEACAWYT
jgi:hypothetical protein